VNNLAFEGAGIEDLKVFFLPPVKKGHTDQPEGGEKTQQCDVAHILLF